MVTDVQEEEVALLRAGDAQAFRSLLERLQQSIIGYLHRLVGDVEVARDLAQDTFLQVYKELPKVSTMYALDAWIYRIATNYGLRYLKRRRLRQFIHFSFHTENTDIPSETTFGSNAVTSNDLLHLSQMSPSFEEQTELRMLVKEAMDQLAPKDAACVMLHYGEGMTYEQIASIMSLSPEAVRKRVSRGVVKFRAIYERDGRPISTQSHVIRKS